MLWKLIALETNLPENYLLRRIMELFRRLIWTEFPMGHRFSKIDCLYPISVLKKHKEITHGQHTPSITPLYPALPKSGALEEKNVTAMPPMGYFPAENRMKWDVTEDKSCIRPFDRLSTKRAENPTCLSTKCTENLTCFSTKCTEVRHWRQRQRFQYPAAYSSSTASFPNSFFSNS